MAASDTRTTRLHVNTPWFASMLRLRMLIDIFIEISCISSCRMPILSIPSMWMVAMNDVTCGDSSHWVATRRFPKLLFSLVAVSQSIL